MRLGETLGVTDTDFAEAGPVPARFWAATVNWYVVPGVRPVTVWVVPAPTKEGAVWATAPMYGVTT